MNCGVRKLPDNVALIFMAALPVRDCRSGPGIRTAAPEIAPSFQSGVLNAPAVDTPGTSGARVKRSFRCDREPAGRGSRQQRGGFSQQKDYDIRRATSAAWRIPGILRAISRCGSCCSLESRPLSLLDEYQEIAAIKSASLPGRQSPSCKAP